MKFYDHLYVSSGLSEEKKDKLIQKMLDGKYPLTAQILVLIEEGENQLEFFSTALLYQHIIRTEQLFVVGIAESYMDAIYMVEDITKEVYQKTGTVDIRSYIMEQQQKYEEGNNIGV